MTFSDQRITVMGLGRFGGGVGVSRWLAERGAHVLITDLQPAEQLGDSIALLRDLIDDHRITLRLGEHLDRDFSEADLVVANPAVPRPWNNPFLEAARRSGVPITTEIRLTLERIDPRRVIGVTGTAGKSTTSAMIHHILTNAGVRAHLGGNIGGSLLPTLHAIQHDDWLVLELSSFMLYWLGEGVGRPEAPGVSPHISVFTNLEPNHLDWHGTFEHYQTSKQTIFRYQHPNDIAIDGRAWQPPETRLKLLIPGRHNQQNAQFALAAAAQALDAGIDELAPMLSDFSGLPHRLQFVGECGGVRCYNDSKATTPGATVLAVESFGEVSRVHLIAGGYDKGADLSPIAALGSRLGGLYTIGATGRAIAELDCSHRGLICETLDRAVDVALDRAGTGDVLLLSPGCASWDQFASYEDRGRQFETQVQARAGTGM